MSESTASHDAHATHGHEQTDVSAWAILLFIAGLALLVVVASGGIWVLFTNFAVRQAEVDRSRFPLAAAEHKRPFEDRLPPAPRLEGLDPNTSTHSGVYGWPSLGPSEKEKAQAELDRYAWVDAKAGVAQIPIERAIDMLAGKLPVRKEKPADAASSSKEIRGGGQ
jgi:hypothetical protein